MATSKDELKAKYPAYTRLRYEVDGEEHIGEVKRHNPTCISIYKADEREEWVNIQWEDVEDSIIEKLKSRYVMLAEFIMNGDTR